MKIIRVRARNFLSFAELDAALRPGLAAVVGENRDAPEARSNGAGKSALVDAVAWALYGETTRGLSGDEVIRLAAGRDCAVDVEFDDGTTVTRHRKDTKRKNAVVVARNGREVQPDRARDAQAQVDRLVGMGWETFRHAILFGQDAGRFLALPDAEKKRVLEGLLGASALDRAAEAARAAERDANAAASASDHRADILGAEAAGVEREATSREASARAAERDRLARIAEIEAALAAEPELESPPRGSTAVRADLDAAHEAKGLARRKVDAARKTAETANGDVLAASTTHTRALESLRSAERGEEEAEAEIARVKALSGPCPVCLREIEPEHVGKAVELLEGRADRVAADAHAKYVEVQAAERVRAAVLAAKAEADRAVAELLATQRQAEDVEAALLAEMSAAQRAEKAALEAAASRAALTHELARLRETSALDLNVAPLREQAAAKRASETEARTEADSQRARAKDAAFWSEGFGLRGLRSMLLDSVLPFLEERANRYLGELTGGTVRIALSPVSSRKSGDGVREAVSCAVSSSCGGDRYEGLSGGERQRVDVAMALALFDLARTRAGADLGLAVFDEIFERLDDAGCASVAALLRREAPRWGCVLLVTHLDALLAEVPSRIVVVKEGGVSRVLLGEVERDVPELRRADGVHP